MLTEKYQHTSRSEHWSAQGKFSLVSPGGDVSDTHKGNVVEVKLAEGDVLHMFEVELERLAIWPGRVEDDEIHPDWATVLDSYRDICGVDTLEVQSQSQLSAWPNYNGPNLTNTNYSLNSQT